MSGWADRSLFDKATVAALPLLVDHGGRRDAVDHPRGLFSAGGAGVWRTCAAGQFFQLLNARFEVRQLLNRLARILPKLHVLEECANV